MRPADHMLSPPTLQNDESITKLKSTLDSLINIIKEAIMGINNNINNAETKLNLTVLLSKQLQLMEQEKQRLNNASIDKLSLENIQLTIDNFQSLIEREISILESLDLGDLLSTRGILKYIINTVFPHTLMYEKYIIGEPGAEENALRFGQEMLCSNQEVHKDFVAVLKSIARKMEPICFRCFISYAWPKNEDKGPDRFIQPFLVELSKHILIAGFGAKLDIENVLKGENIESFMTELRNHHHWLVIGTQSLAYKFEVGTNVRFELALEKFRKTDELKRIFPMIPVLVSGEALHSFPWYVQRNSIIDFRKNSYATNLKVLLWHLSRLPKPDYDALWQEFEGKYPGYMAPLDSELTKQLYDREKNRTQAKKASALSQQEKGMSKLISSLSDIYIAESKPLISNVPIPSIHFTGRAERSETLNKRFDLRPGSIIKQVIVGLGGIGKSQLARKYAHGYGKNYQIVWWLDATNIDGGYRELTIELNKTGLFSNKIEIEGIPSYALRKELFRNLRPFKLLLIIDNVENEEALNDYLPNQQGMNVHILVTSRNQHWQQFQKLPLEIFSLDESISLIASIIELDPRHKDQHSKASELAILLDNLPLAIAQAAHYIKNVTSISNYIELFQKMRQQLWKNEKAVRDYPATVAVTWQISMQKIKEQCNDAAEMLNYCCFLDSTPIHRKLLLAFLQNNIGIKQDKALLELNLNTAIKTLLDYSLIDSLTNIEAIKIHTLVQAVTRDKLDHSNQTIIIHRVIRELMRNYQNTNIYFNTSITNNRVLLPHLTCIYKHIKSFETVSIQFFQHIMHDVILLLTQLSSIYTDLDGEVNFNLAIKYLKQALDLCDSQTVEDPLEKIFILRLLSKAYKGLGGNNITEAIKYLTQAREILDENLAGNLTHFINILNELSLLLQKRGEKGDLATAINYLECALTLEPNTDPMLTAMIYSNLGMQYSLSGNLKLGKDNLLKALNLYQSINGVSHLLADTLNNLGNLHKQLGQPEDLAQARIYFISALTLKKEEYGEEHLNVAKTTYNLAELLLQIGDKKEAIEYFQQALSIREKLLEPNNLFIADTANKLAETYGSLGNKENLEQSLKNFLKAYAIYHQRCDQFPNQLVIILYNIGNNNLKLSLLESDLAKKMPYITQAINYLKKAKETGNQKLPRNHPTTVLILHTLGEAYSLSENNFEAIQNFQQALEIRQQYLGNNHTDTIHTQRFLEYCTKKLLTQISKNTIT